MPEQNNRVKSKQNPVFAAANHTGKNGRALPSVAIQFVNDSDKQGSIAEENFYSNLATGITTPFQMGQKTTAPQFAAQHTAPFQLKHKTIGQNNPVIQYKKLIIETGKASKQWGNTDGIEIAVLLRYIKTRRVVEEHVNLSDEGEFFVHVNDILAAAEHAAEDEEYNAKERGMLKEIIARLNSEHIDAPVTEKDQRGNSSAKVKVKKKLKPPFKKPIKRNEKRPRDKDISTSGEEHVASQEEQPMVLEENLKKSAASAEKHGLLPITDIGMPTDKSTQYYHNKANNRIFLTNAPGKVLKQYGESGRLIEEGEYDKKGKGGEQADLRYADFVQVIKDIFKRIQADPENKGDAIQAIKILNEHLYVIHDFKFRVRQKKSSKDKATLSSWRMEIEKCKREIEVLNSLLQQILNETDTEELSSLITQAIDYFNITYGFGISDSVHPGDMFGGPLDVNHVNFKSLYNVRDYKAVFKRSEDVRKVTNGKFPEDTDYNEPYLSASILDTSKHILDKDYPAHKDSEEDFFKSQGIGRKKVKKLRSLANQKEEGSDSEFSEYFEDSDSDNEEALTKFVPNETDTIAEFAQKKQPFLNATGLIAKTMNEMVLLRQSSLKRTRSTRLLETVKEQRKRQTDTLKWIASDNKTNIADKVSRQLKNIDDMIKQCKAYQKKGKVVKITGSGKTQKKATLKSTRDIIAAWSRSGFAKGLLSFKKGAKPKITDVIADLEALKKKYLALSFQDFRRAHAKKGVYTYDKNQNLAFVNTMEDKELPAKKKQKVATTTHKVKTGKTEEKPVKKGSKNPVQEWAGRLGGRANYGSGNLNNCLIYAIANVMGAKLSKGTVKAIRKALVNADLMGVNYHGYLPAYGRVVEQIAQYIQAHQLDKEGQVQSVQIRIDSVLHDVAPVIIGTGPLVHIFHDGNHFWALDK